MSNCYTGGAITVSEDTLKERVVSGKLKDLVGLSNKEETVIQGDGSLLPSFTWAVSAAVVSRPPL